MNNRIYFQDFYLVIVVIFGIFIFGFLGLTNLLPLLMLILSFVLIIFKQKDMIYILFLLSMTTNNLVPKEKFLLGVIGIQQILGVVSIFFFITSKKYKNNLNSKALKTANWFLLFMVLYILYYTFKNYYFEMFGIKLGMAISRTINFGFLMYAVYIILNRTENSRILVFRSSLAVITFLGITSVLSKYLISFGYYISIDGDNQDRYNGFIGNGDANTLALVMVLGVAMILNSSLLVGWKKFFLIPTSISILSIGLTGSRSGLVLLLLVTLMYFLSQKDFKKVINAFFVLTIVGLISLPIFKTNLERLQGAKEEQTSLDSGTSNRVGKWVFYLKYLSENPEAILRGGDKELAVGFKGVFLVAHNIYIQIVYNSGIFFLLFYFYLYYRVISYKKLFYGNTSMMIIPLILGIGFISDYGAILFFVYSIFPFIKLKEANKKIKI